MNRRTSKKKKWGRKGAESVLKPSLAWRGATVENIRAASRKYILELYDRPSAPLELNKNPDAKSRGTRDNAVRLRHVESARVPLRHAAPSPPQVLDSLHRLAKAQSRRPPDFLSGHAYQDGK